jgi:SAM-dependent methyltransferase
MTAATQHYALDNDRAGAGDMLDCLSGILDPATVNLLSPYVRAGGRCLELGAGNGTIAGWMADAVGAHGDVVATDLKPDHIRHHPRVRVLRHDLRSEPLPAGPFDVIHARLLLAHLPQRESLVRHMADALAPGGTLAIEDWGVAGTGQVLYSPWPHTARLYQHYQRALIAVFAGAGNDPAWSTRVHATMAEAGLTGVRTAVHADSWTGGMPGCQLPLAVSAQLRAQLVEHGLKPEGLDTLRAHLADPRVVLLGNLTWSVTGRRAEG